MLSVRLFGRFSVHSGGTQLDQLPSGKPVELFCYLLLQRGRPHSREVLASLLWGDCTTSQSKKYLRQALWQIKEIVACGSPAAPVLLIDRDSVRFNAQSEVWLDVAAFEDACLQLQDLPRGAVTNQQAEVLKGAVAIYRGDLLEGWYQDWCLFERERLQNLYLLMLDKLMAYCEDHQQYEAGLEFGERILRLDRAHERTYQEMMRLHHLAGDRAGALRLYQRCTVALQEELSVTPGRQTVQIVEQIRGDCVPVSQSVASKGGGAEKRDAEPATAGTLTYLRRLLSVLNDAQSRIEEELQAVDQVVRRQLPIPAKRRVNEE